MMTLATEGVVLVEEKVPGERVVLTEEVVPAEEVVLA